MNDTPSNIFLILFLLVRYHQHFQAVLAALLLILKKGGGKPFFN